MSITLTNGTLVQINGATVENDVIGAVTSMTVDYLGQTAVFVLRTGSLLNGNINVGNYGQTVQLTINLATGSWSSSAGQSGTMGPVALNNFNSQFKADRNTVETFAAGGGNLMPGTQVPW